MNKRYSLLFTGVLLLIFAGDAFGQQPSVSKTNKKELDNLAAGSNAGYVKTHQQAVAFAKSHGWAIRRKTKRGGVVALQGINKRGFPVYLTTYDNTIAAATTGTN